MRLVGFTGRAAWRQSRTASHVPLWPAPWPHWWPQVSGRLSHFHPFKITFCHPFFFFFEGGSSSPLSVTKNWNQVKTVFCWEASCEGSTIYWAISAFTFLLLLKGAGLLWTRSFWRVHFSPAFLGNFQLPPLIISPVPLSSVGCYGVQPGCTVIWSDRWSLRMSNIIRAVGRWSVASRMEWSAGDMGLNLGVLI